MLQQPPLFKVIPAYQPQDQEVAKKINSVETILYNLTGEKITSYKNISKGMNTNYKLFVNGQEQPKYQLKILSRNGYPSVEKLAKCHELLLKSDVSYSKIIHHDSTSSIFLNGYVIQQWLMGTDGSEKDESVWLRDFIKNLKIIHSIKLPIYGAIEDGSKFDNIHEYSKNLDKVIDTSFGATLLGDYSIWDLHHSRLTTPDFLPRIFNDIAELSLKMQKHKPHLVHGDMSAANILYTSTGTAIIDWDEAKSHWWPSDLARTLFFLKEHHNAFFQSFINQYNDKDLEPIEIDICIKLEHIRQLLRYVFMAGFEPISIETLKGKIRELEERINKRLEYSYI